MQHCNTLNTFKKHLKTHLFTSSLTSLDWPVTKRLWSSALWHYINVCMYVLLLLLLLITALYKCIIIIIIIIIIILFYF